MSPNLALKWSCDTPEGQKGEAQDWALEIHLNLLFPAYQPCPPLSSTLKCCAEGLPSTLGLPGHEHHAATSLSLNMIKGSALLVCVCPSGRAETRVFSCLLASTMA